MFKKIFRIKNINQPFLTNKSLHEFGDDVSNVGCDFESSECQGIRRQNTVMVEKCNIQELAFGFAILASGGINIIILTLTTIQQYHISFSTSLFFIEVREGRRLVSRRPS